MKSALVALSFLALGTACGSSSSGSEPAQSPSTPTPPTDAPPPPPPASGAALCGGLTGAACPQGQYCSYPKEAMCGAADQTGNCTPIPEMCTEEFKPVCGCNDKTYPNACHAAKEGISVGRDGECPKQ